MNLKNAISITLLCFANGLMSCNSNNEVKIVNEKKGSLKPTFELVDAGKIRYALDSMSAAMPQYVQIYGDSAGKRLLTFLNTFNNAIYVYDYKNQDFITRIQYSKTGNNGIRLLGYHIKNLDSIYVYDQEGSQFALTNQAGEIASRLSLIGDMNYREVKWLFHYPQFYPITVAPILANKAGIIFPGQYMWSIPDSIINRFRFTASIDFNVDKVTYYHGYPKDLYGNEYFWDDPIYTAAYADLMPDNNRLIYSFPISHNIYTANLSSEELQAHYGGSNDAGTIHSLKREHGKTISDPETLKKHIVETDLYAAIKYDKYRNVYYRFLRKAVTDDPDAKWQDKPITIIILNEQLNYLGETTIGTSRKYNWENSFVTAEGLNIEYLDKSDVDEEYLHFNVFLPKAL